MVHNYQHVLPKNPNEPWCRDSAIVILFGENKKRTYDAGGAEIDAEEVTYMPFAIQNVTDLDHIDVVRKRKNYGVAGVELLENLKSRVQAAKIRKQIDLLTKSPEMEAELKAKNDRIAELEAKLAKVDEGGDSSKDDRIAELEKKLAKAEKQAEKQGGSTGSKVATAPATVKPSEEKPIDGKSANLPATTNS